MDTMESMVKPKRPRVDLTVAQKQEICRYYEKNPSKTIKNLQDYFSSLFGLRIGNSTIGTILKRAEHWNSIEFPDNVRRTQSTKFSNMEKQLFEWICNSPEAVSESQIQDKASDLIKEDRILTKEWNSQRGWITSFKRRFNLVLVPLENKASDLEAKGYRPGKMPPKRDPVHRVQVSKGRKPSRVALIKPPKTPSADTSSIIYDAAIENILQDAMDTTDDDPETESGAADVHQGNSSSSPQASSAEAFPVGINIVSSPQSLGATSTVKINQTIKRDSNQGVNSSTSSKLSSVGHVSTSSIIQKAAFENILRNDTESASKTQQNDNSNPSSSTAPDIIPFVITTENATTASSVTISSAQKAMTTLMLFFEQNPSTSREDLEHLRVVDAKLKWLSAKDAINTLRTYIATDPSRSQDLQYLNDLEQRI